MKTFTLCAVLALLSLPTAGLEPYLVKDIDPVPTPAGSDPSHPVTFGGAVLFSADDGLGRQLWRSDGTAAGTWQITDIPRGEPSPALPFQVTERLCFFLSGPPNGPWASLWASDGTPAGTFRLTPSGVGVAAGLPVQAAGVLYFVAWDAEHGEEPWRSDGTPAGTYRVADVRPGFRGSAPQAMMELRGRIWFAADDGQRGGSLWSTDGTETGTVLAVDPYPAVAGHGVPELLCAVGGRLAFFMPPAGGGVARRLWAGDGTQQGTVPLQSFSGAGGSGFPAVNDAVVQGGRLYFVARDRKGQELWTSDGTLSGTRALTGFAPPDAFVSYRSFLRLPRQPGVHGRYVFMADDGLHGMEPWITDGTPQGTRLLRDICPGVCYSDPVLGALLGGRLYFSARSPFHGIELWSTDGTRPGTRRVSDICPGDCSSFPEPISASPYPIVAAGGRLFFTASDPENGPELWTSDGTAAGTVRISGFESRFPWFYEFSGTALDGRFLFAVDDGEHGNEMWVADRTAGPAWDVRLLADFNRSDVGGSLPQSLRPLGSQVVFRLRAGEGAELWKSDGTAAGTVRVRAFGPGELDGATPEGPYAEAGGLLFYHSGGQLWRTDGTETGTLLLAGPGCCGLPPEMEAVGSTVFFAHQDEHGDELWASDGTAAGTRLVLDVLPGSPGSKPRDLTAFQGRLWFSAEAPGAAGTGRELWTSDGTAAGTVPMAGLAGSNPRLLTVHAGRLWFFAAGALWSSDGTAAGTRLEIDLAPGSDSSPEAQLLASLGDRLVFSLQGGGLWATDGTAAGTHEILDRAPDFPADQWTVFGGRLWFLFQEGYLWTSDGTAAGTAQLLDRDGNPIYLPYRFAAVGDRLVVMAQGPFGLMLFESDGTPAGTFAVEPRVAPGAFDLTAAGGRAFFAGYDPATGWELWAVRP